MARKASLQNSLDYEILNAKDFFRYANEKITGIKYFFVPSDDVFKWDKVFGEEI